MRSRRPTLLAMVAALAAVAAGNSPAAGGVGWQAPAECGDAQALRARIDARLGRPLGDGEVEAIVTVAASDGAYRATLRLAGGDPRELVGATCGEVVDAVAFVLAVAVRDAAAGVEVEVARARDGAPAAGPRSPPVGVDVDVGVGLAGDASTLPAPTVGLALGVAVARGRWSLHTAVGLWYPQTAHAEMPEATDVRLVSGSLAVCRAIGPLRACGATSGGPMTGAGLEDADRSSARRWYAGIGAAVAVRRSLGRRLALEAGVEALVAVARPRFVFDSGAEGYRAPPATIRASVTLIANILGGH